MRTRTKTTSVTGAHRRFAGGRSATAAAGMAATATASLLFASTLPADATYPGDNGRILWGAFQATDRSQADIWSARRGGGGLRQLTDAPGQDICPAVSADGKQVAFCSNRTGNYEIWTMRTDGRHERQLTFLGDRALFPDWSPDGRRVVFSLGDATSELWTVDVRSGATTRLLAEPGTWLGLPVWSPDGRYVLYVRQEPQPEADPLSGQLWRYDMRTGKTRQLTFDDTLKDQTPDWSPDGRLIAYEAAGDIWLMRSDGSGQRQLTDTPEVAEFGTAFSPRGNRVAFTGGGPLVPVGQRWVQTIRLDGTGRRVVAGQPGLLQAVPAWGPRHHVSHR